MLTHLTSYSGEEATALHVADFAIDGRCLLLGPTTPSFQRRLDALNALADPGGQSFAGLPAGARSRVCGSEYGLRVYNLGYSLTKLADLGGQALARLPAGARSQGYLQIAN